MNNSKTFVDQGKNHYLKDLINEIFHPSIYNIFLSNRTLGIFSSFYNKLTKKQT